MGWRDDLSPEQTRRLDQITRYAHVYGYPADSDQDLLLHIAEVADTKEWLLNRRRRLVDHLLSYPHYRRENPYTCSLLRRFDWLIHKLLLRQPYWSKGRLCIKHCEAKTFFPGWMYGLAADIQNRWYWTRLILQI